MTLNQIIGNKERTSRIDTELWKKINEKYSGIETKTEEKTTTQTYTKTKVTYYENDLLKIKFSTSIFSKFLSLEIILANIIPKTTP